MLGLRAMVSLASDSSVFALGLHLEDIGVQVSQVWCPAWTIGSAAISAMVSPR